MKYSFPPDVAELVQEQLASGRYGHEDEVLREALAALEAENEEWQAIREALDEIEAGDEGLPLDEAFAEEIDEAVTDE